MVRRLVGALAAVLVLVGCAEDAPRSRDASRRPSRDVAFPALAAAFAGDGSFLLIEPDRSEQDVAGPVIDDRPSRILELIAADGGIIEHRLPAASGPDLSAPSAMQLPDGGWLLVAVPCPPDPDVLTPDCDGPSPVPLIRRLDPHRRAWSSVGTVPTELAGGSPELVGVDRAVAVIRRMDGPDWRYWTVDLDSGAFRALWHTPKEASPDLETRSDCAAGGQLVVVDHSKDAASQHLSIVDVDSGELHVTRPLDVGSFGLRQVLCDESSATIVGTDRRRGRLVAYPLHDDGTVGAGIAHRMDPDTVGSESNRRTVVYFAQQGDDPSATTVPDVGSEPTRSRLQDETISLTVFNGGSWLSTSVTGAAIDFVHPDLDAKRVLVEHHDDRWSIADVR